MAEKTYYVRIRGKVMGPFGLQKLRSLRDRGQLGRFHELSQDRQQWQAASLVAELFPEEITAGTGPDQPYGLAVSPAELPAGPASQPASPSPEVWFFVNADDKQEGPVTQERLTSMWRDGLLSPMSMVWKEGMVGWQAISTVDLGPRHHAGGETGKPSSAGDLGSPGKRNVGDAIMSFLSDPVGGLPDLCHSLGNAGSFWLGLAFCIIFDVCFVLALALATGNHNEPERFPWVGRERLGNIPFREMANRLEVSTSQKLLFMLKLVTVALLPLISLALAIAIVRTVTGKQGCLGYDMLISGSALLPPGLFFPVAVLLGVANFEVIAFLYLLILCLTILILNSGFTRVLKLSDRGAILAIPATLLLTIWLSKVVITAAIFN
jgi:hypothetical protein